MLKLKFLTNRKTIKIDIKKEFQFWPFACAL